MDGRAGHAEQLDLAAEEEVIPDQRLALLFACAHPAVDAGIRAPLILQVVLGLDPAAHWIADYYPVDSVEDLPDGRLLVVLRAADTRWLRTLVLRQAGAARVLEPDDLRKAVHDRASAALAAYA